MRTQHTQLVASLCVFLSSSFVLRIVQAHPTFARNKALLCEAMTPSHGAPAQDSATFDKFFTLKAAKDATGTYHIEIQALNPDHKIKGYLITARDACTGQLLSGNWTSAQADQIITCNKDTPGLNAVHHRPRRSPAQTEVKHDWVPISEVTSLQFMATVVEKKDTFWVKQSVSVVPCKQ